MNTPSDNSNDCVNAYLNAIAKTPLLAAAEEVELARAIEAGRRAESLLADTAKCASHPNPETLHQLVAAGKAAFNRFVQANLRLVVSIAAKYVHTGMPLADLIQEGNTGLIRAVEKFDYTKGFKFSTYATWWVRQAISRGLASNGRIVRLPTHIAEQINQMITVRHNLDQKLNREPTYAEIAAELNTTANEIAELARIARDHVSLDAPLDEGSTTVLGDLIATVSDTDPESEQWRHEQRVQLAQLFSELDERSADVIRRRFGLNNCAPEKLQEIGARWGITAERARQLEREALKLLRSKASQLNG